jgi:hypothetical protein
MCVFGLQPVLEFDSTPLDIFFIVKRSLIDELNRVMVYYAKAYRPDP